MSSQKKFKNGLETTLSAKFNRQSSTLLSRRQKENSTTLHVVSPFQIPTENNQTYHLNEIKNINNNYVKLFKEVLGTTQITNNVLTSAHQNNKTTRQQKYKMACWKILQKNQQIIKNIDYKRKMERDLQFIKDYLQQKEEEIKPEQLTERYISMQQKLEKVEKEYSKIINRRVDNLQVKKASERDSQNMNRIEKQFKKMQKALKKQIEKKEFYENECESYQKSLERLQLKKQKQLQLCKQLQMKLAINACQKERQRQRQRKKSVKKQKNSN